MPEQCFRRLAGSSISAGRLRSSWCPYRRIATGKRPPPDRVPPPRFPGSIPTSHTCASSALLNIHETREPGRWNDSRGYIDRSCRTDWINYSAFFGRIDRAAQMKWILSAGVCEFVASGGDCSNGASIGRGAGSSGLTGSISPRRRFLAASIGLCYSASSRGCGLGSKRLKDTEMARKTPSRLELRKQVEAAESQGAPAEGATKNAKRRIPPRSRPAGQKPRWRDADG